MGPKCDGPESQTGSAPIPRSSGGQRDLYEAGLTSVEKPVAPLSEPGVSGGAYDARFPSGGEVFSAPAAGGGLSVEGYRSELTGIDYPSRTGAWEGEKGGSQYVAIS